MGRRAFNDSPKPHLKPVEKIEVSEKHIGRRLIAAAVFLLIAVGSFAYFILGLVRGESGWTEITALSSKVSCSGDFVFLYELGADESAGRGEKRTVTAAYTTAAENAYWMFENVRAAGAEEAENGGAEDENGAEAAEGAEAAKSGAGAATAEEIHGIAVTEASNSRTPAAAVSSVRYINDRPNEIVTVDEPLYEAFAKLAAAGSRNLYLTAVYTMYNNLFDSEADPIAAEFDPRVNEDAAAYVKEALAYANDPASVNLELLGDSQVRLHVSEEYLAFAEENGIESFIDFYWMKNAFIADYLAEELTAAGCTRGCISSFDGFVRNLDGRDVSYSFNIYDRVDGAQPAVQADSQDSEAQAAQKDGQDSETPAAQAGGQSDEQQQMQADSRDSESQSGGAGNQPQQIRCLAQLQYRGPASLVYLRDYEMTSLDRQHYYQMADGEMRTSYIDPRDGLCRNSINSLVTYSYDDSMGCADILLAVMPVYIADEFDAGAVEALAGDGGGADSAAASAGAIYSIYRQGAEIRANDPTAEFEGILEGYTVKR